MVDKLPSEFLGCLNPCSSRWPNLSDSPINFDSGAVIQKLLLTEMEKCEECNSKFSLLRRKKYCANCGLSYCNACLTRSQNRNRQCKKCNILSQWPISREEISSLRVRDLIHYLNTCKIRTDTLKEKKDLVELVVAQLKQNHERNAPQNGPPGSNSGTRRNVPATPTTTVTVTIATTTTTTTRDDGIRVRPLRSRVGVVEESPERASSTTPLDINESEGIRVFPSEHEGTFYPDLSTIFDPTINTNQSDDTSSSSSWSVIPSDGVVESTSSDSVSQSSNQETSNVTSTNPLEMPGINDENLPPETSGQNQPQAEVAVDALQTEELQPSQSSSNVNVNKQTLASNVIKLSSITDEDNIKELSVRQCKEILTLHRVDFSGVWEKHELVSKVKMLWRDYRLRQEEEKNLTEDQMCKICMDAVMDCVLLECGHIVSCTECGKQMAECPICRQNVLRVVKTFRA